MLGLGSAHCARKSLWIIEDRQTILVGIESSMHSLFHNYKHWGQDNKLDLL